MPGGRPTGISQRSRSTPCQSPDFFDSLAALRGAINLHLADRSWHTLKNVQVRAAALLLGTRARECGEIASEVKTRPRAFGIGIGRRADDEPFG